MKFKLLSTYKIANNILIIKLFNNNSLYFSKLNNYNDKFIHTYLHLVILVIR